MLTVTNYRHDLGSGQMAGNNKQKSSLPKSVTVLFALALCVTLGLVVVGVGKINRARFARMEQYVRDQVEQALVISDGDRNRDTQASEELSEILSGTTATIEEIQLEDSLFFVYWYRVTLTDGRLLRIFVQKTGDGDQEFGISDVEIVGD